MKLNKLGCLLLLLSANSFAIQEFQVSNNAEIDAVISDYDVNRISISGARITQVKFKSKLVKVDTDEQNGQIFVYPIGMNQPSLTTVQVGNLKTQKVVGSLVSIFVMDDQGRSFNLRLRLHAVPSETVLIKPLARTMDKSGSTDFTNQIVTFIEDMYLNQEHPDGYKVVEENTTIKLWKEVDFELYKTYSNDMFTGSVFYIRNKTNKQITLAESLFWKVNTVAVAIEKPVLDPGEITRIFVMGANHE